jgi:tellurite resistance protein
MDSETHEIVEARLSVFDDEPDLNDWVEIFSGALMAMIGLYFLLNPGNSGAQFMQWFSSAVFAIGAVWAGHGLKDMAVKEIRRSIAVLEATGRQDTVDYGLIRDVLLHSDQYKKFLLEAYERAYEDGIISDEEHDELQAIQAALGMTDEEAALVATRAAINSAIRDGKISDDEMALITDAATRAKLSKKDISAISGALEDGKLDDAEKDMLNDLLGKI